MKVRLGQEVRMPGHRGTWRVTDLQQSPSFGPCAKLTKDGKTRIIPLDRLKSKSGRPLEGASDGE